MPIYSAMPLHFAGKHCAVVGATGIIGAEIARAFAHQGAVLSLLGRTAVQKRPQLESRLPPYTPPVNGGGGGGSPAGTQTDVPAAHRFIALDVSDRDSLKHVFSASRTPSSSSNDSAAAVAVGPVDILINCAGVSQTTLLKRTPDAELAGIVDTNLLATMLVCKHAKIRPNGCIINVSSLMATKGSIGATAYAASKAGVVGFTRALCREMAARSVRVNALLPGWVESPMWDHLKPELKQAYLKETPLGRVAYPEEIADAAVFLASNKFANNCVLNLDGGLSAA